MVHSCNSITQHRRIRVQGYPQLHSKFKASPSYLRLCLQKHKTNKKGMEFGELEILLSGRVYPHVCTRSFIQV